MGKTRTPIGAFIHCSWGNMNIRAGKYKHLQTKNKCKAYENVTIEFTREEYKEYCINNKDLILSLERPSVDRIDSNKNYTLDNIQIIELSENVSKKRSANRYLKNSFGIKRGVILKGKKFVASITSKGIWKSIGSFSSKEDAYEAFKNEYFKIHGEYPW